MRERAKVDGNQPEIVEALKYLGISVQSLGQVGGGCPDLLLGDTGWNLLMEVKLPKGQLNQKQEEWHAGWRGPVCTARTVDEAVKLARDLGAKDRILREGVEVFLGGFIAKHGATILDRLSKNESDRKIAQGLQQYIDDLQRCL